MTSSNPAAELVPLVTGYRVSQAIHVAAALGIADLIKDEQPRPPTSQSRPTPTRSSISRAPGTRSGRRVP